MQSPVHGAATTLVESIEAQAGAPLPGSRRLAARRKAASDGLTVDDALVGTIELL